MRILQLVFVAVIGFAPIANAQNSDSTAKDSVASAQTTQYRNPQLAAKLGLIPGWGHVYAGEYLRGYAAWVGTTGGVMMGPVIFQMNNCTLALFSACRPRSPLPYQLLGAAMFGMGLWTWFSSARDAPHAAERANVRHARKSMRLSPVLGPSATLDHTWQTGLAVSW